MINNKKYFVFLVLFFIAADFSTEIVLENPEVNITYTDAFRIENLNYTSGNNITEVFINYSLIKNCSVISSGNTTKKINKYSKSKTSNITFSDNSSCEVCVSIKVSNDENTNNNFACKTFFEKEIIEEIVENTSEEENGYCNTELEIMKPTIFEDKALLDFDVIGEDYNITYWVEDLFGNIIKNKVITTNDNTKQYTPKEAGAYILKTELDGCKKLSAETFFIVKKTTKNSLISEIKDNNPLRLEVLTESEKFVDKGIKITIDNEIILTTDLMQGNQEINIETDKWCGEKEILIKAGEFDNSYSLVGEDCKEEKIIEAEISTIINNNKLFAIIYLPRKEKIEMYLRKNKKKIGISKYYENSGLLISEWDLKNSGTYEIIAKLDEGLLSSIAEYKAENIEKNDVILKTNIDNIPKITGNSVVNESKNNIVLYGVFAIIIFLIGDKFKKYRKSSVNTEEKNG